MGNVQGGVLSIRTCGDQADVEVSGTREDILFNWVAITHQVSRMLNVPPEMLAIAMSAAVRDYLKHDLNYEIHISGKAGPQHGQP